MNKAGDEVIALLFKMEGVKNVSFTLDVASTSVELGALAQVVLITESGRVDVRFSNLAFGIEVNVSIHVANAGQPNRRRAR